MRPVLWLLPFLVVAAPAAADEVVIGRDTLDGLRPEDPEKAPAPFATHRRVELRAVDGGLEVKARWTVVAPEPGWLDATLFAGPDAHISSVTIDGRPADVISKRRVLITTRVTRRAEIALTAFVPGDPARAPVILELLPASTGRLDIVAPGLVPTVTVGGDGPAAISDGATLWTGAPELWVSLTPPRGPTGDAPLVVASAGVGLTVGDAELRGRARLDWAIRRGAVDRVSFRATDVGADLTVGGPNVREVRRSGGSVEVLLQEPARDAVRVDLSWTTAVPAGAEARLPLPRIEPEGAFRVQTALQVARDGEVEVIPELSGLDATSAATLPEWGQGLIEGTPHAAWKGAAPGRGSLALFRFEALSSPPVVIDVAAVDLATSEEGRILGMARFEVRNERASHLAFRPPPGLTVLGVRVDSQTAFPFHDADGTWRIPLVRSLETVDGLLSFPVEVILLGEGDAWGRSEARTLALPAVDAPIAVSRVTVHLPPRWRSREGARHVVDSFSEGAGITYGFASATEVAEADVLFRQAVDSWMSNDFSGAQGYLDQLGAMGAESGNIDRLQGNLDVVGGKGGGETAGRRIKEQARSRASGAEREALDYERKAEEAELAGDYDTAVEYYGSALRIQEDVAQLEQDEAYEVKGKVAEISSKVATAESKRRSKLAPDEPSPAPPAPPPRVAASQGRGGLARPKPSTGPAQADVYTGRPDDSRDEPNAALPSPKVHASAVAVTIPAVGEAVRYQQVLLPPHTAPEVVVHAKFRRKTR